jgi:RNA polymerase sigma-70 factor (ECF subfamily)
MSIAKAFNVSMNSDVKYLEQFFRDYNQFVYRTAYSVTGSAEDAEDVLQTVFVGLLRRELPPELSKNPKGYFYRAAFNLSLNTIRYRKRHPSTEDVEALKALPSPSKSEESDELEKRLHEAIAELSQRAAEIMVLRYVHNQRVAEIARILGTSRSAVAVSLFRSRSQLKKLIRASFGESI